MTFPSEIFGCGENERQSSEILNVIAPIALAASSAMGGQRWREMPDAVDEEYDSADTRNTSEL